MRETTFVPSRPQQVVLFVGTWRKKNFIKRMQGNK